jgi:hypothetical protein
MSGSGNPLGYDYRDARHVERYRRLVIRNADGSTEGRDPRGLSADELGELPGPLAAIRAKCLDCSAGSASEARKCTAIGCALWPYRMGTNHRRAGIGNTAANFAKKPELTGGISTPDEVPAFR